MARKKIRHRTPKTADERYIGSEPEKGDDLTDRMDLMEAYRYFNYFNGRKEAVKFLVAYLEKADPEKAAVVKQVNENLISLTLGWVARLRTLECLLSEQTIKFFDKTLEQLLECHSAEQEKKQEVVKTIVRKRKSPHLADLEEVFDQFEANGYKTDFVFSKWVEANNVGPGAIKEIADYYRPILEEVQLIETDRKVREAYGFITSTQAKEALIKFLGELVGAAETVLENRKRARKPRAKKAPNAEKIAKNVQVLKEDRRLNITSMPPVKMVGSEQVILFNTKNNVMIVYVAKKGEKLTVSGSSVVNFDPDASVVKTIRKPQEVVPVLGKAGKREATKIIKELSTKESKPNSGRIGKETILLNVF